MQSMNRDKQMALSAHSVLQALVHGVSAIVAGGGNTVGPVLYRTIQRLPGILVASTLMSAGGALSAPVNFTFHGNVSSIGANLAGAPTGTATIELTLDSAAAAADSFPSPTQGLYLDAVVAASLTLGSLSYALGTVSPGELGAHVFIQDSAFDFWSPGITVVGPSINGFAPVSLEVVFQHPAALSSDAFTTDLSGFAGGDMFARFTFFMPGASNDVPGVFDTIRIDIDNFTTSAVPEPLAIALFGTGILGLGLVRSGRSTSRA
jgi:hypothetical protein